MKKFLTFMAAFIAVAAAVAAAAYWLNYFMAASGKKFSFSIKDILPKKKDGISAESEASVEAAPSCSCNDAVCAVDMCMPY